MVILPVEARVHRLLQTWVLVIFCLLGVVQREKPFKTSQWLSALSLFTLRSTRRLKLPCTNLHYLRSFIHATLKLSSIPILLLLLFLQWHLSSEYPTFPRLLSWRTVHLRGFGHFSVFGASLATSKQNLHFHSPKLFTLKASSPPDPSNSLNQETKSTKTTIPFSYWTTGFAVIITSEMLPERSWTRMRPKSIFSW